MLQLKNITKNYISGDTTVKALKGVSIEFRKSELVSILGQSGCGKTTLLNIIGGLDQYTSGDLIINGKSTKEFKSKDWDSYRNHSIGFVFQSYNLIMHQTVLSNVELALTLSGVSKSERKQRATEALQKVGLGDQLHKKPNQMSGGQMQRVAIARALVNNPDIILADEPTGALDTQTSIQIMDILKEIAKDKLVIMVTHNPELAQEYSTRIIKLLDGKIVDDSMPYQSKNNQSNKSVTEKLGKTSMSFMTSLSLSLNNLLTKKGRTFLIAFASSIGIIGIALILSLSTGVQNYIDKVEEETLGSYPIQIDKESSDMSGMLTTMMEIKSGSSNNSTEDISEITSNNMMANMISSMVEGTTSNDMKSFKKYIEDNKEELDEYISGISYKYDTQLNIYNDTENGLVKVNPSSVFDAMGMGMTDSTGAMDTVMSNYNVWSKLPSEQKLIDTKYELLYGKMPSNYDEVVIITDSSGKISDYSLYALGILDSEELSNMLKDAQAGKTISVDTTTYTYDELLNNKFKLLLNTDYYEKNGDIWEDKSEDDFYIKQKLEDATEIKVVGVIKSKDASTSTDISAYGGVGYTPELMEYLINEISNSKIVKQQQKNKDIDIFTGIEFETDEDEEEMTMEDLNAYILILSEEEQAQMNGMIAQMQQAGSTDEEILAQFSSYIQQMSTDATYEGNLKILGVADLDEPSSILIYPKDFEAKTEITEFIDKYNDDKSEDNKLNYTDYVGLMMSSITTIINAITYILIGFSAISLIVSGIMIAIITYISVLERTKEIGILRAIGASKHEVSTLFNAETFIIGLFSGVLGIVITVLIGMVVNNIVYNAFEIENISSLSITAGAVLVCISVVISIIAGLIPSKMAAKKDPVESLRSE